MNKYQNCVQLNFFLSSYFLLPIKEIKISSTLSYKFNKFNRNLLKYFILSIFFIKKEQLLSCMHFSKSKLVLQLIPDNLFPQFVTPLY